MNPDRPILSLEELDAFDSHAPQGARRRFCCPLCGQGKPKDGAHRSLSVESATGLWKCFRCEASGQLREQWPEKSRQSRGGVQRALGHAFGLSPVPALPASLPIPPEATTPASLPSDTLGASSVCSIARLTKRLVYRAWEPTTLRRQPRRSLSMWTWSAIGGVPMRQSEVVAVVVGAPGGGVPDLRRQGRSGGGARALHRWARRPQSAYLRPQKARGIPDGRFLGAGAERCARHPHRSAH